MKIRKTFLIAACCAALAGNLHARNEKLSAQMLKRSVVKVYVTSQSQDYLLPWQPSRPVSGSGTGFIISGRRILTNAHIVSDANFIEVSKEGDAVKYQARLEFVGHDCDLAILTVEDPAFFAGTQPLHFGDRLPELNDTIVVVGYPIGGERISITRGVVSRIDYSVFSHSGVDAHLVIQVDAAINPGNSGGPAMLDGKVIGLAFQGLYAAQNIGYAIALPVITRFLADIEDGVYHGYPELGVQWMEARNPALRDELRLRDSHEGVVITHIDHFACSHGLLQSGDVLLAINGHPIAKDGTILLDGVTTEFVELLERRQCGEKIGLTIWRNGAESEIDITLTALDDAFIFRREYDRNPEYFIVGGLVFAPLTRGYISAAGMSASDNAFRFRYYMQYARLDELHVDRDQLVVLILRLAHPINAYAEPFINAAVCSVNGRPIRLIQDIKHALLFPKQGFHIFRFKYMDNILVLNAAESETANNSILAAYGIPSSQYFEQDNHEH